MLVRTACARSLTKAYSAMITQMASKEDLAQQVDPISKYGKQTNSRAKLVTHVSVSVQFNNNANNVYVLYTGAGHRYFMH